MHACIYLICLRPCLYVCARVCVCVCVCVYVYLYVCTVYRINKDMHSDIVINLKTVCMANNRRYVIRLNSDLFMYCFSVCECVCVCVCVCVLI